MRKDNWKKIAISIIIIIVTFTVVNLVIYLTSDHYTYIDYERVYVERDSKFLILTIVGMSVLVLFIFVNLLLTYKLESKFPGDRLIPSIRHSISIRNQKRISKKGKLRVEDQSQIVYNRFGTYERALQVSSQVFPITIDNEEIELTLDSLIYDEEILDEKCGVCKLTFNQGQLVVFCPKCETLFHRGHLTNWLQTNDKCPICKHDFLK